MKRTKFVLLTIGLALIIFGACLPTMFKSKTDDLSFQRQSISGYYYCNVYITSKEDYEITKAVITLKNAFDEHDTLTKTVESLEDTNLLRSKEGDEYVYTITLHLTSSEYFNYTEVESVSLTTSIGARTAEKSIGIIWTTPVMIILIFFGVSLIIGGVAMIITSKAQKNSAQKARLELAKNHPEINTTEMTDEQILSKYAETKRENSNGDVSTIAAIFGVKPEQKEKICEYCGSTNSVDAKKCSSCGANLKGNKK